MNQPVSLADLRHADVFWAAQQLEDEHDPGDGSWGEHPRYSRDDWGREASDGDTQVGYWVWVVHQLAMHDGDLD